MLLAPGWLWLAGAAAAAVVAMHFIARQRPRPAPFPTARFVPDIAARAPSPARQPTDLLLLLLRVLALLAAGSALARPIPSPHRRPIARVVVVDASPAARSATEALDSARAHLADGDTLVRLAGTHTLSASLIAALRASTALRDHADSIELVLVSPFVTGSFDAATDSLRRLWPGRATLVPVSAIAASPARRLELLGGGDDPLRPAVALLGSRAGAVTRIARGLVTAADSAFARSGGVLVVWPRDPATRWPAPATDTVGAVIASGVVVVAPFARDARLGSDSSRVVARWVDGAPAAVERHLGSGCVREVAIRISGVGDLVLRHSVGDLVAALSVVCDGPADLSPALPARLATLRRDGPLMPARQAPAPGDQQSSASSWLLALAALLLLGEMAARPRPVRSA